MSVLLNPFILGSAPAASDWYAVAKGDGTDLYDDLGIHAAGVFTIPSAWNGRHVRVVAGSQFNVGADTNFYMTKNGGSADGLGGHTKPALVNDEGAVIKSAPLLVATGDTIEFVNMGNTGDGTWCSIELLPTGYDITVVNRITSGFGLTANTLTTIDWNNEVMDAGGYHDNASNPSRLTIPAGKSGLFRLSAGIKVTAPGSQTGIRFLKNGAVFNPNYFGDTEGEYLSIISPPTSLATGDYVQAQGVTTNAVNVEVSGYSWFAIEELDPALKYAIAETTSTKAIPSGSVWTAFACDAEVADVGNWYTAGNGFFTVPGGVTRVRVGYFGRGSNTAGDNWNIVIRKNGAEFAGMPYSHNGNGGNESNSGCSGVIECSPGDTFDFYARTSAGSQSVDIDACFWIEEVLDAT